MVGPPVEAARAVRPDVEREERGCEPPTGIDGAVEDRVLTALTLLTRAELDRRLGRHPLGELMVDIQRPERTLYRIALAQQESPQVEDLVTVVYRREASSAP